MDNFDLKKYLAENKLNESQEGSISNVRYEGDTVILDTIIGGEEVKDLIFKDTGEVIEEPLAYDEEWVYAYEAEHNGKKYSIGVGFHGNPSTNLELSDIVDDFIQVAENKLKDKKQLDENFVGMPMVGNIFDRPKADYELAYEHYLGKLNENDVEEGKEVEEPSLYEEVGADGEENPIDSITMDVPLFIRMLEFAREDASTDMDLHDVAEKATALSAEGEILSMDNYEDIVGGESNIKEGISSFLNRVEKGTRMLSDVMSVVLMAKQDGEGAADKAVQMMMDKYEISQEEALQAVTNILKKFERFI